MADIRVLIADQSPITRKIIRSSLRKLKVSIIQECVGGEQVLEFFDQDMGFNMLFLDAQLSDIDAQVILAKLHERDLIEHITIFLISSQLNPNDYRTFEALGVKHFLTRPFNATKFDREIAPIVRTMLNPDENQSIFCQEYRSEILELLESGTLKFCVDESKNLIVAEGEKNILCIQLNAFLQIAKLARKI
ncbi:response regulator [Helicobacter monodelphidis]|uniref:response regulator n=1 Tax=Helicobacter sp. 15-1451 TaxID=2004995 RepID=UPI0015EC3AE0|nr:response regulator [Helicobacter sp. 15-1451]